MVVCIVIERVSTDVLDITVDLAVDVYFTEWRKKNVVVVTETQKKKQGWQLVQLFRHLGMKSSCG